MKKKIQYYIITFLVGVLVTVTSCQKFLAAKPDIKLATVETLAELQGLLDNFPRLGQLAAPAAEASSDNYYLTQASYNSLTENLRRIYTFEKDFLFTVTSSNEWALNYVAIYHANSVLANADKMDVKPANQSIKNNIIGQALTFRGMFFLRNVSLWSLAYDANTAQTDLGIPLKLSDDFNESTTRPSLAQTFEQIISDFKTAIPLLENNQLHPLRPSKAAAYGMLARTYLYMRKYPEARLYADSCLKIYNKLIDYNTLRATDAFPFKQFNEEVIFANRGIGGTILSQENAKIPLDLYNQYEANDLRKSLFFLRNTDGTYAFKGFYEGNPTSFAGVGTDEMYLTRAECAARAGETQTALADLNALLIKRYRNTGFVPVSTANAQEALVRILAERRKQLLFRNLRWLDIKRLNKEGANISIQHPVGNTIYTLPPNDLRFALAIPEDVLELSGIQQNLR